MKNLYDTDDFFTAYAQMPRSREGLSAAGEWHQLEPLIPTLTGKVVLDLGCGYGWHCKYAADHGAASVLGIDQSQRMIQEAEARNADPRVTYRVCDLEEYDYPTAAFDLVISNLVLHYVPDLELIFEKVYRALKPGGTFLFNIEHPVFTAGVRQEWLLNENGVPAAWPVDNYFYPGPRETVFLGQPVLKFHHTLTQILTGLRRAGFTIDHVEEAQPSVEMLALPGMADEMRRPMMLLIRAIKLQ